MSDDLDPTAFRAGERRGPASSAVGPAAAGLSADDLITLNEEIAGMARAGLPLDQGLAALAREMGRGRLQRVTAQLAADLQAGFPLPEALARQGGRVPPFYAGLVAAGIRTGRVSDVLATLTIYTRSVADLRAVLYGALFYPAVVMGVALALYGLICYWVLPPYEQFFNELKLTQSGFTRAVMTFGRHPILYVLTPLLTTMGLLVALQLTLRLTERGRRAWVRMVYAIPFVGTLIRAARLAAFTELLAILVDHSLPLPEAFGLAGTASSDPSMVDGARRVAQDLRAGLPLGDVLRERGVVPELVAWMTAVGELRGTLGPTLHQVAALYRRQTEMRAAVLRTILPPLLILVTAGVVVALFVFAVIVPFIELLKGLSGTTLQAGRDSPMMNRIANLLLIVGITVTVTAAALMFWRLGGLLVVLFLGAVVGWILYTVLHYRYLRQEEVLHLMTTAAAAGSPLGPALWAYLDDRSRGWGFDRKLQRLALCLESGMSLAAALRATPGVAARETVLAASVGESTGRLALCLHNAPRWRFATVWLEAMPRLLYPLLLLFVVSALFTFQMVFIAPKFEKIFADFRLRLPRPTDELFRFGRSFLGRGGAFVLVFLGAITFAALLYLSSAARWYCPGLGRLFRMHIQGRVLTMLGILLEADRPLPAALAVLLDSGYFTGVARGRLQALAAALAQGEALAPSLRRYGLLPARMVPLVQAAERAQHLPWALAELGAHLGQRTERLMRRASTAFFLAAVLGAGLLVGFVALAWFLPLIKIMTELL